MWVSSASCIVVFGEIVEARTVTYSDGCELDHFGGNLNDPENMFGGVIYPQSYHKPGKLRERHRLIFVLIRLFLVRSDETHQ